MIIFMPPRLSGPFRPPKTVEECDRRIKHLDEQIAVIDTFLWVMVATPWIILAIAVVVALVNWFFRS